MHKWNLTKHNIEQITTLPKCTFMAGMWLTVALGMGRFSKFSQDLTTRLVLEPGTYCLRMHQNFLEFQESILLFAYYHVILMLYHTDWLVLSDSRVTLERSFDIILRQVVTLWQCHLCLASAPPSTMRTTRRDNARLHLSRLLAAQISMGSAWSLRMEVSRLLSYANQ